MGCDPEEHAPGRVPNHQTSRSEADVAAYFRAARRLRLPPGSLVPARPSSVPSACVLVKARSVRETSHHQFQCAVASASSKWRSLREIVGCVVSQCALKVSGGRERHVGEAHLMSRDGGRIRRAASARALRREGKHGPRENHSPLEASRGTVLRSDDQTTGRACRPFPPFLDTCPPTDAGRRSVILDGGPRK